MGRATSSVECLRQAQECLELAANASDADLRNRYLDLAKHLTELAATLDADQTGFGSAVPRIPANTRKGRSGRRRTNN